MSHSSRARVAAVVRAYHDPVVRAYCWGRFLILRQRFLDEIGQYLPLTGRVLDVGCGFGLFSLYYAAARPGLQVEGVDLDPRRIAIARAAAGRLGLTNVRYEVGNATALAPAAGYQAVYMLDIVHHIPAAAVRPLVERLHACLDDGCRLVVKDVARHPVVKRWFTFWLDKLMDPSAPVCYWRPDDLGAVLREVGFEVHVHAMVDILPYPHVLYACRKREGSGPRSG